MAQPDAEAVGLALEAAGLSGYQGNEGAPSMFPGVRVAWEGEGFRVASAEEVDLPAVSDAAAMEIQLEARALARKWGVQWCGGVGAHGVRVAFRALSPFTAGEPPVVAGSALLETAAKLFVAHQMARHRAMQIAWAHAGGGRDRATP
jgi:hypothetical protein